MRGIYYLAKDLIASQEELFSVLFVVLVIEPDSLR
jgi:hypothetical protein